MARRYPTSIWGSVVLLVYRMMLRLSKEYIKSRRLPTNLGEHTGILRHNEKTVNASFSQENWVMDTTQQIFGVQELYRPKKAEVE